jgi:hypothetical protein
MLPSDSAFHSIHPSDACAAGPIPIPNATSFGNHLLATQQLYSSIHPSWNTPPYDTPPHVNMTWNVPPWTPSMDYTPQAASRAETYQYTAPTGPPVFAQHTSSYHQSRESLPSADHYVLGSPYEHYTVSPSQTPGIPSVSLPTSSSYFQGHYP